MANFRPLKQYMLLCLDELVRACALRPPFLDAGCGRGDVSAYLGQRGWHGLAVDASPVAVAAASSVLRPYPAIRLERQALDEVAGTYQTIVLWDVLEHIEDDGLALRQLARRLTPDGALLLSVPSNPIEWRWDDDFYGHYRRYTLAGLTERLAAAGLAPELSYDFTYPVFWLLRRAYTRLKRPPVENGAGHEHKTSISSARNAWDLPLVSAVLDRSSAAWGPVFKWQFRHYRHHLERGHGMLVVARRPAYFNTGRATA
jgi:SAM-dependent methyltransferase